MFRLYMDKGTRSMIDVSENEQDIIDTMGEYLKYDSDSRFLIIESGKEQDSFRGFIRGYEEYIQYANSYNEKLKQKSCIELKKEIVKKKTLKK